MASDPQRESILANIKTTLQTIVAGSTYHYTPARVTREPQAYEEISQYPTYVIVEGPEIFEYYGKRVVNWLTVYIRCFHQGEKSFENKSQKLNNMTEDVRAALVADVERGGFASNTEIINVESDEGYIDPFISAEITLRIQYLTLETSR